MVGQVYPAPEVPTEPERYFSCYPVKVGGDEAENGEATLEVDTEQIFFSYCLGPGVPVAGDLLISKAIGDRWVSRKKGGTRKCSTGIPLKDIYIDGWIFLPDTPPNPPFRYDNQSLTLTYTENVTLNGTTYPYVWIGPCTQGITTSGGTGSAFFHNTWEIHNNRYQIFVTCLNGWKEVWYRLPDCASCVRNVDDPAGQIRLNQSGTGANNILCPKSTPPIAWNRIANTTTPWSETWFSNDVTFGGYSQYVYFHE